MRKHLLVAGVMFGLTVNAAGALADYCGDVPQGITGRTLYPPDGAVGVPLNVLVAVRYQQHFSFLAPETGLGPDLVLRPRGGQPVRVVREVLPGGSGVTPTAVIIKPLRDLLPDTTYEVLDQRTIPCPTREGGDGPQNFCGLVDQKVFASFTTGNTIDHTAPQFTGVSDLDVRPFSRCAHFVARPLALSWAKAVDDRAGEAVLYNLYQVGVVTPLASYLPGTSALAGVACNYGLLVPHLIRATPRATGSGQEAVTLYVRAVDWAGNEDANQVQVTATQPCDGSPPADGGGLYPSDGGGADGTHQDLAAPILPPAAVADGGAGPDAPATTDALTVSPPPQACSAGPATATASSALFPLLGLLLLTRCRRRR